MTNNYPALIGTSRNTEHKVNPPLKISSIGTEIKKNSSVMPDGSALLTNTGNNSSLKGQGIDYIIHAVPKMRSSCSSDEEFIEIAVKAAQNSIILADREGIKSLAICLIGGEIYRGSCDPQKLAEGIIRGVINQIGKVDNLETISLIDWKGNPSHYLLEKTIELWKAGELPLLSWGGSETIFDALAFNPKGNRNIVVRAGDVCDKNTHGASAIVNSENAGMSWGGSVSGAIKGALGTEASKVDQQRKDLMKKFNDLNQNNDQGNVRFWLNMYLVPSWAPSNFIGNYYFFAKTGSNNPEEGIIINQKHKEVNKWKEGTEVGIKSKYQIKFQEKKQIYEVNDWLEVTNENGYFTPKDKPKEKPDKWKRIIKNFDNSLEQSFSEEKIAEWQKEEGSFNTAEGVKNLLKSVKGNNNFLTEIASKYSIPDLNNLIANNSSQEVITIIKRFEYDQLSPQDKENKNQKIKKHYSLEESAVLTNSQIDSYLYKVAVGKINENEQDPNNTINPEKNILKYLGISALILTPLGLLLVFFIRKRKK